MIAVFGVVILAVVAGKLAGGEAAAHLHSRWAGLLAFLLVLLAAAAVAHWLAFPGRGLPRNRVRTMRNRARLGLRPGPGHATAFELWFRWGRGAAFRRSRRARRSLPRLRRYTRTFEHSVLVGWGYFWHRLLVPFEEHILLMAPPRSYKTALLSKAIMHWPGPVIATSTKPDLFALTSGLRSRVGPAHVFNPQGIGGIPSTFQWSPLDGADAAAVAIRRADQFAASVSQKGVEDSSFWSAKASDFLRALFAAAALGGYDLRRVHHWIMADDVLEAQQILAARGYAEWAGSLTELGSDAKKTAATVRMTMSRALAFLADPELAESVLPAPGAGLDIAAFLRGGGTLYMIAEATGAGDEAPVSALFACLASEIRYQAALYGSTMPGARLDPPLLMALDESTQVCPCPIPSWLADSGGKGVTIITVCHGEAQLADRWGEHGKQTILDTSGVKVWFGGITATETLEAASKLAGDTSYDQQGRRRGEAGQSHLTQHPVLTPAMVRQLPPKFALIIRGTLAPVVARAPIGWRDWRYLLAKARGLDVAVVHGVKTAPVASQLPDLAPWPVIGGDRPALASPAASAGHPWMTGNGHSNGHGAAGGGHDAN